MLWTEMQKGIFLVVHQFLTDMHNQIFTDMHNEQYFKTFVLKYTLKYSKYTRFFPRIQKIK